MTIILGLGLMTIFVISNCHNKNYTHRITKKYLIGNWIGIDSSTKDSYYLKFDTDTIYISISILKSKNYYQPENSNMIIA